ncbi:MAG: hypothetical protein ABID63_17140 [Pseudomonadota bacterium]
MVNIQGKMTLVGTQLLTLPRPVNSQTGEYSDKYSADEWKALWDERRADFNAIRSKGENQLNQWLDENANTDVTKAYYLDGQLVAVFGEDNINVSNGMNYGFEYRIAKNAAENQGLSGDELTKYVENRIELELRRKYGTRLQVEEGSAGSLGTLADYREDLFGGNRWPGAENLPKIPEIDWNAPSPAEAGTWQGPLAKIDTATFLGIQRLVFENQ